MRSYDLNIPEKIDDARSLAPSEIVFNPVCHGIMRKKHRVHLLHVTIDRPIEKHFKKRRLPQWIESNQ